MAVDTSTFVILLRAIGPVTHRLMSMAQWREASAWQREQPAKRWLLVESDALATCADRERAVEAGRSNRRVWLLVPAEAVTGDCAGVAVQDTGGSRQGKRGTSE